MSTLVCRRKRKIETQITKEKEKKINTEEKKCRFTVSKKANTSKFNTHSIDQVKEGRSR